MTLYWDSLQRVDGRSSRTSRSGAKLAGSAGGDVAVAPNAGSCASRSIVPRGARWPRSRRRQVSFHLTFDEEGLPPKVFFAKGICSGG